MSASFRVLLPLFALVGCGGGPSGQPITADGIAVQTPTEPGPGSLQPALPPAPGGVPPAPAGSGEIPERSLVDGCRVMTEPGAEEVLAEGVKLRGTLAPVPEKARYYIDLIAADGSRVRAFECQDAAFVLQVPRDVGQARLKVMVDAAGAGPNTAGPGGTSDPFTIAGADVDGLSVRISDPGGAP